MVEVRKRKEELGMGETGNEGIKWSLQVVWEEVGGWGLGEVGECTVG